MAAAPLFAGTTGKLSGRVLGDKGEPLAGANIRVIGQRLGAVTDEEGRYVILGIPGGIYEVRCNLLGYAAYVAGNVEILPDFTKDLDIRLSSEAVQLQEVRVEATRPLLQKDATGTTRFLSADDIQKLPTRGYRDAAAQQTGVVNFQRNIDNEAQNSNTLIVRGGRPNEIAYFVDGFSQQDPLTGTSSTSISNNAIEEVVLLTGGFAPEYGRIMSGVTNVITQEGRSNYFGAIEAVSDALAGDWVGSEKKDYNIYDASLGGPVWPGYEDMTFYVSGERRWQRDRAPSFMPSSLKESLKDQGLSPDFKPNNSSGGFSLQGKLAWQVNDNMSMKVGGLGSQETWRQFTIPYIFNLDHVAQYEDRNQSYFGTFNHVLSPKTFYTVGVNYFETMRKRGDGVHFDRLGDYYRTSNPRFDINLPMFWQEGHVFDDYLQRRSSYYGVQTSLTSQVNSQHQLKFGGDYQTHTLRFFQHYFPVQLGGMNPNTRDFDAYGYDLNVVRDSAGNVTRVDLVESDEGRDGPKHPKTWSLFGQDKFEREGLIVNGGLRVDYINTDTPALVDNLLPLGDPADPSNNPSELEDSELTGNKTYVRVSPRLGAAFPVDDKTVLRFNYGQFYQQPNLQDLYVSYRFLEHKVRTGGYFVPFGNPNLKPERTTAYEVGVARQVGDNARFDVTAYYKDVKDLVQVINTPSSPNNFSSYQNSDFATIKGVDVGFSLRPVNNVSANLAYSLSFAQGTGSVSQSQRNIAWTASQTPKQTAPLDFDQRHKFALNLDWRLGEGQGPLWSGFRLFENTGINVLLNVASGTPYTPTDVYNEATLAAVALQPSGPINSRYGPWTSNLDFKATRGIKLGGYHVEAFAWVLNVLDSENAFQVYTSSGSAETTNWLNTADGQTFLQTAESNGIDGLGLYRLAENDPNFYATPRIVRFGVRAQF
jgi:outer membrane receptor protein involved in Fe transport